MHEIARHAIHSVETLDVAVHTVTALHDQYKRILQMETQSDESRIKSPSTQKHMEFQVHLLQNLRSRSQANEKRIQNEITLVPLLS